MTPQDPSPTPEAAYCLRVFTPQADCPDLGRLGTQAADLPEALRLHWLLSDGPAEDWRELLLQEPDGPVLAWLRRHTPTSQTDWNTLLAPHQKALKTAEPSRNAEWIGQQLAETRQVMELAVNLGAVWEDELARWDRLYAFLQLLVANTGGLVQADYEGWYAPDWTYLLWQVEAENAQELFGPRTVGVLDSQGQWRTYELELSDAGATRQFRQGLWPGGR